MDSTTGNSSWVSLLDSLQEGAVWRNDLKEISLPSHACSSGDEYWPGSPGKLDWSNSDGRKVAGSKVWCLIHELFLFYFLFLDLLLRTIKKLSRMTASCNDIAVDVDSRPFSEGRKTILTVLPPTPTPKRVSFPLVCSTRRCVSVKVVKEM